MGVKHICTLVALLLTTSLAPAIDADAKRKKPESTQQTTETLIDGKTPKQLCELPESYFVYENKLYIVGSYSHQGKLPRDEADRIESKASKMVWETLDYLAELADLDTSQIREDIHGANREVHSSFGVGGSTTYNACIVLEIDPNLTTDPYKAATAQQLVTTAENLRD